MYSLKRTLMVALHVRFLRRFLFASWTCSFHIKLCKWVFLVVVLLDMPILINSTLW